MTLNDFQKRLIILLGDHLDRYGEFPTQAELSELDGATVQSVGRRLRVLKRRGILTDRGAWSQLRFKKFTNVGMEIWDALRNDRGGEGNAVAQNR